MIPHKLSIVIGDVHGCSFTLQNLLKKLPPHAELIFVGDLCDRGNYSKEVIEYIIQNKHLCLLGNHESYMLESVQLALESKPNRWIDEDYMGGKQTMKSYHNAHETLEKHLLWMEHMPLYLLKENYFITHAFALPYFKRRDVKEKQHSFLVNRTKDIEEWGHDFEEGYEQYDLINIFGHETFQDVFIQNNLYGIDTSCVYGNKLSALELGSMNIYEEPVHPLDIAPLSATDIAIYFETYTQKPLNWHLEDGSITFGVELDALTIERAIEKMDEKMKHFLKMFCYEMVPSKVAPTLNDIRLSYLSTTIAP